MNIKYFDLIEIGIQFLNNFPRISTGECQDLFYLKLGQKNFQRHQLS